MNAVCTSELDIMIQINNEKDQTESLKKNSRVANLPLIPPPLAHNWPTVLSHSYSQIDGYVAR